MIIVDLPVLQSEINLTCGKCVEGVELDITNMSQYINYESLYKTNPDDKNIIMTCPIEDLTYIIQTFLHIKLANSDAFSLVINDIILFNTIDGDQDNIYAKGDVINTLYTRLRAPDVKKIEIYINNSNINNNTNNNSADLLSYLSVNANYINPIRYVFESTDISIPFYDQSDYVISAYI
jgi:hypothetical protein